MVGGQRRDQALALDRHQLELAVELGQLDRPADHADVELAGDAAPRAARSSAARAAPARRRDGAVRNSRRMLRQRRAEHRRADEADRERAQRAARDRRARARRRARPPRGSSARPRGTPRPRPSARRGGGCARAASRRARARARGSAGSAAAARCAGASPRGGSAAPRRPRRSSAGGGAPCAKPYARARRAMRDNPPRMPDETASATQLAPAHADAIEIFAEVLAQSEEEGLGDDFYSRLCEGITRCTALRRVVIFRYDSTRRRILAAGSLRRRPRALRRRLLHARVGARSRARRSSRIACSRSARTSSASSRPSYVERLRGADRRVLADVGARALAGRDPRRPRRRRPAADRAPSARCSGSSARWRRSPRWRAPRRASTSARSRSSSASTSRARSTRASSSASSASRSRSPATSRSTRRRGGAAPRRCRQALGDLRTAMQRPLGRSAAATRTTLAEEVARLRHEYPELGIEVDGGAIAAPPSARAARAVGARRGDPQRRQARGRDARRRAHRDGATARSCSR